MSLTASAASASPVAAVSAPDAPRRVRHQARDAVAVMVFSACASSGVAVAFLLLSHLSRAGR
ncbi:MAG TPA: hypothetical protein VHW64_08095 [Nocardioides sp.]|jgi:hypothetical protein|uniref:hypothetical protein n=1 Tax=Nocardioides sp. TaxID=35761 RepID=UPI002E31BBAF|nr:hypothetical protein [Nocardioides sp.]HEX3930649.1 hypothetical protein [Nocardioides sp.]